ncbi:RNA polymerase sigma factor [Pendulispora albinea]|uniref:RNA polymerase sigma factor n=1 Tax=Pendulispora albinea TaxID=2741071 RepID=A0ABZ2M2K7_9BACT
MSTERTERAPLPTLDVLAHRAQQGDRDALEQLVRGLQDPLYRLALRVLGRTEPARDATQEILVLIVTQLSTFRGESAVRTWAYRIATRYLVRQRKRARRWTFEELAEGHLGQPPNAIAPDTLALADRRILEEEIFLGCTHAMLQSLDKPHRMAFVLGAICELESPEAASILGITEAAFRKRLSRARATLDGFMTKHCGVSNPKASCRCAFQVNHNVTEGRLDPARLQYEGYTVSRGKTSLEVIQALGEIESIRDSVALFRAQPAFTSPEDFAAHLRTLLTPASSLA